MTSRISRPLAVLERGSDSGPGRARAEEHTVAPERELQEAVLGRARRGDQAAARALVLRYQGAVFTVLSRILGPSRRGLVPDLAQETFLRVFRGLPAFVSDQRARLSTWILTIATRLAI